MVGRLIVVAALLVALAIAANYLRDTVTRLGWDDDLHRVQHQMGRLWAESKDGH